MTQGPVAAYVLSSGNSVLTRRTLDSVSWADRTVEATLETRADGLLLSAAAQVLGSWPGWTVVVVEGEVVDGQTLRTALATEQPCRTPVRRAPLSVATDALALPGTRLFWSDELAEAAARPVWAVPGDLQPGVPWVLEQLNVAARAGHPAVGGWAHRCALAMTQEQLTRDLDELEALWLAELLLLSGEHDPVIVRATSALQRPQSPSTRTRWAQLGLAAASATLRRGETAEFCRFLAAQQGPEELRALWDWWAARAAEQRGELNEAVPRWLRMADADPTYERQIDPWHELARDARAEVALRATAMTARDQLRQPRSDQRALTSLIGAWGAADLPPEHLLEGWPRNEVGLLMLTAVTGPGPRTEWRLELLERLFLSDWAPRPQVTRLAASLAARVGLSASITWFERARETFGLQALAANADLNPLALRAQDVIVGVHEQVLSAVCWWLAAPESAEAQLRTVVELAHVDDVPHLLHRLRDVAPSCLPVVIDMLAGDEARRDLIEEMLTANAL